MKLKQRFLLIWYYFTFKDVGYKAMRRKLFKPDFGKCLRNILQGGKNI